MTKENSFELLSIKCPHFGLSAAFYRYISLVLRFPILYFPYFCFGPTEPPYRHAIVSGADVHLFYKTQHLVYFREDHLQSSGTPGTLRGDEVFAVFSVSLFLLHTAQSRVAVVRDSSTTVTQSQFYKELQRTIVPKACTLTID